MRQFKKILTFELKNYFANKVFVGVTIFLIAAIVIVTFFPQIIQSFHDNRDTTSAEDAPIMLVVSDTSENAGLVEEAFVASFPDYEIKVAETSLEHIKEQITSGEADCAFVMDSLTSYTYYVNNLSMYDNNTAIADEALQNIYRMNAMADAGLSQDKAGQILAAQIDHETLNLGKDQVQNFFYTYIMTFALYMVIVFYGQMVATNVATEKSSRAMEVLITSAKPVSMMFGKVIASCLAGLLQLIAVFGSALICFNLNRTYWGENTVIASIFDMPVMLFVYMLIFFVLGFFIYAFMYGAIGSTVSKLEDINTAVMPVTMIFIVAFFVVVYSLTSGTVDTILMKICSYVPLTSSMAMFARIAMSTVSFYEIFISIVILIVSVIGVGFLAAKIYRVGVLLYGTKPKMGAILKAMKKA